MFDTRYLIDRIAVDSAGNIYTASPAVVRRYSPSGVLTQEIGTGYLGCADGPAEKASFGFISGIAINSHGTVFVADAQNHNIRSISPDGTVSTFAGVSDPSNTASEAIKPGAFLDGLGGSARFNQPNAIAIGKDGAIYVAENGNPVIRKITPAGAVTTIAGRYGIKTRSDGVGASATFDSPVALAVGPDGSVYVCDASTGGTGIGSVIRKITPDKTVTTVAGNNGPRVNGYGYADGAGSSASFEYLSDIAVSSDGSLYVTDIRTSLVRVAKPVGTTEVKPSRAPVPVMLSDLSPLSYLRRGGNGALFVLANGTPQPDYQWFRNGLAIPGASFATLIFSNAQASVNGVYTVTASNSLGSVTSKPTTLKVVEDFNPIVTTHPVSQTVIAGAPFVLSAEATGENLELGWGYSGSGAYSSIGGPGSKYGIFNLMASGTLSAFFQSSTGGYAYSNQATITVIPATITPPRLVNFSVSAMAGTGNKSLIIGAVIGGAGTSGSPPFLLRAQTPLSLPLRDFDPVLQIFRPGEVIPQWSNDNWEGSAEVKAAESASGASPWAGNLSLDAAMVQNMGDGAYTVLVSSKLGLERDILAEIYDATGDAYTSAKPRLLNYSGRAHVGAGTDALVAGFGIAGPSSMTVLIRAVGPSLAGFGVRDVLDDPKLVLSTISNGNTVPLSKNDNWDGDTTISYLARTVGMFPLSSPESKDSAILITLPPGQYSASISGVNGSSGICLIEVYEVP
jgi:sugar lactone lactonase YvrE